ncbi:MAG: hypothetical protein KAS38_01745, partial [Anaerolineales bacterium]|nr:hypothetical protein [Anaerolineales bacterium]
EEMDDLQSSVKLLRDTLPEEFSTTIAYALPGTKFYEQVRDRLVFDTDWSVDWEYTAENKLLFQRDRYNTHFYRWVIRWFNSEWQDAWLQSGKPTPILSRLRIKAFLWINRMIVRLLLSLPIKAIIQFQPSEGR